ncbi:MAG: TetR/AcrR family transcriptional regulator C-terminal domain-containing protein [Oscillospiraceae bacterium]|nr:TetR/AcrR family transcriptional regulator C-terminal domain-containing protein [Oscillospiraceae bacterium]
MKRSELTKLQLAGALKDLTNVMPFRKISVSHIADHADMSRKSFYYHFKDKYDLVSFIFDSEFTEYRQQNQQCSWLEQLCRYLYDQRDFYRVVLEYDGQNCFEDHLRSFIRDKAVEAMETPTREDMICEKLLAEAVLAILKSWLTDAEVLDADSFLAALHRAITHLTNADIG